MSDTITVGPVTLDTNARAFVVGLGKAVRLTKNECKLLTALMSNPGRFLHRERLLVRLYGDEWEVEPKIVDVYICRLRQKMDQAGAPGVIGTRYGFGWGFRDDAKPVVRSFTGAQWALLQELAAASRRPELLGIVR